MKQCISILILLIILIPAALRAQVYHQVTHTAGTQNVVGNDITVTSAGVPPPAGTCGIGPYLIGCTGTGGCPPAGSSYTFDFSRPVNIIRMRFTALSWVGSVGVEINGVPYALQDHNLRFPYSPPFTPACPNPPNDIVSARNGLLHVPVNTGNGGTQVDIQTVTPIYSVTVIQQHQYANGATFDFQFTYERCAGQDIELTAPSFTSATYSWTGPNSFTAGTQNITIPNAQPAASGTYTVNVTQGSATVHTAAHEVLVNPLPTTPVVTGNSPLCSGQTLELTASSNGVSYRWSGPNRFNTTTQNPSIPNVRPVHAGTYKVWSISDKGCVSDTGTTEVVVDVPPSVNFTYDVAYGCGWDTVSFRNSTAGATQYLWDFGDGSTDTVANPVHVYRTRGTFSYYVKLIAWSGCKKDSVVTVLTLNNPLRADFRVSADTICQGQSVMFTNMSTVTSGSPLTYFWDFRDGQTDLSENPAHTFHIPGSYHVMLVAGDTIPCYDTAYRDILVEHFAVEVQGDTICPRDIQVKAVVTAPGYFRDYRYEWSPAASFSDPYIPDPILFARPAGTYTYILTVTSQAPIGCTASDTVDIHVAQTQPLSNVTPDTVIPYGSSIQLHAEGPDYFLWEPGSSLSHANIPDPVATPLESTVYAVYGLSRYGCWDTAYVRVILDGPPDVFVPDAFTPDGDGRNDVFRVANHRYHKLLEFRVFNRAGKELFYTTDPRTGWDGTYNGAPQQAGVYYYLLRLAYPDGSVKMRSGDVTLLR